MKIAVLSDIHGNMQALEAVTEDIKKQNCDVTICLGDLAMAGPQPRMAIEYVQNQNNWITIQGNTDNLIAEFSPEIFNDIKEKYPVMAHALADDVIIIEDDKKEFLKNLPSKKSVNIEGVRVLLVHGSPRRNNEDILPNRPISEIEEIIEGTSEDLIFCGHTHMPCGYQTGKKQTVVNVGSIGRPFTDNAKSCYVVANIENGGFSIEHRFVDYDRELAATLIKARGFEGADKISQMLINPSSRHV